MDKITLNFMGGLVAGFAVVSAIVDFKRSNLVNAATALLGGATYAALVWDYNCRYDD